MAIKEGTSFADLMAADKLNDTYMLEMSMDFVNAMNEKLEKDGITRTELAKKLGRSKSQISRVLSGSENITLKTMCEYAAAIQLPMKLVFTDSTPVAETWSNYENKDDNPWQKANFNTKNNIPKVGIN